MSRSGLSRIIVCVFRGVVKLVFTIVTKKVNTRLFELKAGDKYENPQPGTVVNDCVTRQDR